MFYMCESHAAAHPPVSAEEIQNVIHPAHVRFVVEGIQEGIVIFAGPKTAGGGGFILVSAESADACHAYLDRDPMLKAGAQTYVVSEFRIIDHNPCMDPVL